MLTDQEFIVDSLSNAIYYLRSLRDYCINTRLSFSKDTPYIKEYETLASSLQEIGRALVKLTKGRIPSLAETYQIYYTGYTLKSEELTEKLFNVDLATDITEAEVVQTPSDFQDYTEEEVKELEKINTQAEELTTKFISLSTEVKDKLTSNNLFSYYYPLLYDFMIRNANSYLDELSRLNRKEKKDPIQTIEKEYTYNITIYQILLFLRGLINPENSTYITSLINLINNEYPELIEEYQALSLTPKNQQNLRKKSIDLIVRVKAIMESMLNDLFLSKVYFIITPLTIDNFYRNVNYFLYILNKDYE